MDQTATNHLVKLFYPDRNDMPFISSHRWRIRDFDGSVDKQVMLRETVNRTAISEKHFIAAQESLQQRKYDLSPPYYGKMFSQVNKSGDTCR